MTDKIKPYRSSTPGAVPSLESGELAINLADQKTYVGNGTSSVVVGAGKLASLGDVSVSSPTSGQPLVWNGTAWVNNTAASIDATGNVSALSFSSSGTASNKMPVGTTAQRPATPSSGMYRMNSDTGTPEWYSSTLSAWVPFSDSYRTYDIEILLVGGGGGSSGGNAEPSGGGGAGGMIIGSHRVGVGQTLVIVVGTGGTGTTGLNIPSSGTASTISVGLTTLYTASGGGRGGVGDGGAGASGGSGGGGSGWNGGGGGSGTTGQGSSGGAGSTLLAGYPSGGGGGKTSAGVAAATNKGGNGGSGMEWPPSSGTYYAGGGGGGVVGTGTKGTGGIGGGGDGCISTANSPGSNGTANTGGGGGAANGSGKGGNGGAGICVIRYIGGTRGSGGTITSSGGYTYHTFTSSGTFVG